MRKITELQEERAKLVTQMRALLDKAGEAKRALTAEEDTQYRALEADFDRLTGEIDRAQKLEAREALLAAVPAPLAGRPDPGEPDPARRRGALAWSERVQALIEAANPAHRSYLETLASPAYRQVFRNHLQEGRIEVPPEARQTLQMDVFAKGGALVAPLEFSMNLIQAIDDEVFLRGWATKSTVIRAEALGVPTLDTDPADADWTSELAVGSQATMAFGRRELRPHPLAKWVKVSNKLMRASTRSVEDLVMQRLRYKFGVSEEKAFLIGTGAQQPLGVFTASADGIATSRDVSTDNTTTAITADGLINAKHFIKAGYWPRLRWLFHRDAIKQIRKLKDGNGQYLWQPGLTGNIPDRILETPYAISEFAPNTFTTGLYVGIIGDFSFYWIVDALDLTVQRLVELYAATNETGFVARMELDGAPVLGEAFARVKLA